MAPPARRGGVEPLLVQEQFTPPSPAGAISGSARQDGGIPASSRPPTQTQHDAKQKSTGSGRSRLIRYFTRLHTDSALVPVEVAGFVL